MPVGRPRTYFNDRPATNTERSRAWRRRVYERQLAAAKAEVKRLQALVAAAK
jgi:hypothetical protein